jgi:hypothetical protein
VLGKLIHLIEGTDLVRGELCVTVCVVVRWMERGKVYTFYSEDRFS